MLDRECRRCWIKSKAMVETSWKKASVDCSYRLPASGYCACRINAKALHLKLHRLHDWYNNIAIAMCYPAISNINLCIFEMERSTNEQVNAKSYTTLRKKAMDNSTTDLKHIIPRARFVNALRNTGLQSPLRFPFRRPINPDVFLSNIAFLS